MNTTPISARLASVPVSTPAVIQPLEIDDHLDIYDDQAPQAPTAAQLKPLKDAWPSGLLHRYCSRPGLKKVLNDAAGGPCSRLPRPMHMSRQFFATLCTPRSWVASAPVGSPEARILSLVPSGYVATKGVEQLSRRSSQRRGAAKHSTTSVSVPWKQVWPPVL